MIMECAIHGSVGICMYSADLLELQPDGMLPEITTVEVKDEPDEIAFFRLNMSPKEAEKYPIVNNSIPFDELACTIIRGLSQMCGFCFDERRKALERQQQGGA